MLRLLLKLLPLLLVTQASRGTIINSTTGCKTIHPPREGGIRYRGLTPEQIRTVESLPFDYEIEYVCRGDREIVGPKVRKCLPNGTWTDMQHPSRCLRTCPRMHLKLENGHAEPRDMVRVPVEGTWIDFHCDPGFRLVGNSRSFCTKVGKWDFPKPTCEVPSDWSVSSSLQLERLLLPLSLLVWLV